MKVYFILFFPTGIPFTAGDPASDAQGKHVIRMYLKLYLSFTTDILHSARDSNTGKSLIAAGGTVRREIYI